METRGVTQSDEERALDFAHRIAQHYDLPVGADIGFAREMILAAARQARAEGSAERAKLDEALRATNGLVEIAQGIIGAYLPPDGMSQPEALNMLIETFDGPDQREAKRLTSAALAKPAESGATAGERLIGSAKEMRASIAGAKP